MRIVIIVVIVAALGIAGVVAGLINQFLTQQSTVETSQQAQVVEAPKTKILVASMDLPAGTVIAEGSLGWRSWPDDALVPTYIVEAEGVMKGMIGKAMLTGVLSGQPMADNVMFDPGVGNALAQML